MSTMHWLVIVLTFAVLLLICLGLYYALYRWARLTPPALIGERSGVAGWLLVLVGSLVFLGPLVGAGRLSSVFRNAEALHPDVLAIPGWHTYKIATWVVYAIATCISVYAGIALVQRRTPSAVQMTKAVLWIVGPVATVAQSVVVPWVVLHSLIDAGPLVAGLIVPTFSAVLWTAYLSMSKRVKTTYGV